MITNKPTMTKKTYIRAAELVREHIGGDSALEHTKVVGLLCELFSEDNPRFDSERFREACDPVNPTIRERYNTRRRPARTGKDA